MWKAIILSALPIAEVRGGIPLAIAQGMDPLTAYIACSLANIIVIPTVFFFLEYIHKHFMHIKKYQTAFDKYMEKTRKKVHPTIEKYGYLGLCIFVAIPLPMTGAYTGTAAAWFLGMNKTKSAISIATGVLIAAAIVLALTMTGVKILGI